MDGNGVCGEQSGGVTDESQDDNKKTAKTEKTSADSEARTGKGSDSRYRAARAGLLKVGPGSNWFTSCATEKACTKWPVDTPGPNLEL